MIVCPHCRQQSQWTPQQAGLVVQCPFCLGAMTLPAYIEPPPTYAPPPSYAPPPQERPSSSGGSGWMILNPFDPAGSANSVERGLEHMQRGGLDSKRLLRGMLIMWGVILGVVAIFVVLFFFVLFEFLAIMHSM